MNRILVTGGVGYIGSHTCVALSEAGYAVTIIDNLCNSRMDVLSRLEKLCPKAPEFIEGDIRDAGLLERIFAEKTYHSVIHFAGLKAVGESTQEPLNYYDNNIMSKVRAPFRCYKKPSKILPRLLW